MGGPEMIGRLDRLPPLAVNPIEDDPLLSVVTAHVEPGSLSVFASVLPDSVFASALPAGFGWNAAAMNRHAVTTASHAGFYPYAPPTPEAMAELIRQRDEYKRQEAARAAQFKAASERAQGLLEEKIGSEAMAKVLNGGAYPVQSKHWPDVVYYVPKNAHERIKVMQAGVPVLESCLVTTDDSLPWADVMLHRITALEIDETIVMETGVKHELRPDGFRARARVAFGERMRRLIRRGG